MADHHRHHGHHGHHDHGAAVHPGDHLQRYGDEIVVCGQMFRLGGGTRVYLWMDPGGYDAYRVEKRFSPLEVSEWDAIAKEGILRTPNRYGMRRSQDFKPPDVQQVRGGGWNLDQLRRVVDQFVIHCDACGTSQRCFEVLQDRRGLSCHFLIDLDGVIYQTIDLKERAWHATICNDRAIGVELANLGAYGEEERDKFAQWYHRERSGKTRINVPPECHGGGIRTKDFVAYPIRPNMVIDELAGRKLRQYDYTANQYKALIHLTAALSQIFPRIKLRFPEDPATKGPLRCKLPEQELANYSGVLGHYHIQAEKNDPGPAFQWEYVIGEATKLISACPHGPVPSHPFPINHGGTPSEKHKPPKVHAVSTQTMDPSRGTRSMGTQTDPVFDIAADVNRMAIASATVGAGSSSGTPSLLDSASAESTAPVAGSLALPS